MSCLSYKNNINSQNGEDGIIEFIFKTIGITNGNFIEFGAWDGKHLSNSYKLLGEGWKGIYIEGDAEKYKTLCENFGSHEGITLIQRYVSYDNDDSLDNIIEQSSHKSKDFDFISIDVDGLDYNIFKSMNKYLPKVICIEVNAGHDPMHNLEIPIDIAKHNVGQSMYIISQEADRKGYFPLCYTGNLFLVKKEYKDLFEGYIKDLKSLYIDFLNHLNEEQLQYLCNLFIQTSHPKYVYDFNRTLYDYVQLKYSL